MIVNLVRSTEISLSRFETITEIIKKFKGPVKYVTSNEDTILEHKVDSFDVPESDDSRKKKIQVLSWETLFNYCENFREKNSIPQDEIVVLFTDHGNDRNWFSSWEPSGRLNFFIQTSGWEDLIEADSCYPVLYELATIPLFISTCKNLKEVVEMSHKEPRGCPFDMCANKKDSEYRLRTGDLCPQCREHMITNKLDPGIARQAFSVMDEIRSQILYRERLLIMGPSRLEVDTKKKKLRFTDNGNRSVTLSPRELTIYLFFLKHSKGVEFRNMPDFEDEIRFIYRKYSSDANLARFNSTLKRMICDNGDTDSLSELVYDINKKISETVYPEIVNHYLIKGKRSEPHFISVNRELVTINEEHIII